MKLKIVFLRQGNFSISKENKSERELSLNEFYSFVFSTRPLTIARISTFPVFFWFQSTESDFLRFSSSATARRYKVLAKFLI